MLARLFPTAYPDDAEAAGDFRRFTEGTLRDGKADAAITVIDGLEDAGLPPELTEDGLVIDVELDEPTARDLDAVVHRPPARAGHPARGRGGRRGLLGRRCPRTTRAVRLTTSTCGSGYLQETLVDALSS